MWADGCEAGSSEDDYSGDDPFAFDSGVGEEEEEEEAMPKPKKKTVGVALVS